MIFQAVVFFFGTLLLSPILNAETLPVDPVIIEIPPDDEGPSQVIEWRKAKFQGSNGETYNSVIVTRKKTGEISQLVAVPHIKNFDQAMQACSALGDQWRMLNESELFGAMMVGIYSDLEPNYAGHELGDANPVIIKSIGYEPSDAELWSLVRGGGFQIFSWVLDPELRDPQKMVGTDMGYLDARQATVLVSLGDYIGLLRKFAELANPKRKQLYLDAVEKLSEGVDVLCLQGVLIP